MGLEDSCGQSEIKESDKTVLAKIGVGGCAATSLPMNVRLVLPYSAVRFAEPTYKSAVPQTHQQRADTATTPRLSVPADTVPPMSNAAPWAATAGNKFREVARTTENPTTRLLAEGLTALTEALR